MKAVSLSLRTKVALAMATVAALVVAAILGMNFHSRRVQLSQEFQAFVRGAAGTTTLALNGHAIGSIPAPNEAASPACPRLDLIGALGYVWEWNRRTAFKS